MSEVELTERLRAAVTYQYMPMAVRKLLSEAAEALSTRTPPQPSGGEVDDLTWLSGQHRLSLSYYSPMYGDDDDQSEEWRVDRESGPINDREWETVGRGKTAAAAIAAARSALDSTGGADHA